ncbi:hypothetical protein GCM10010106_15510 [Thermopolyspora flexuosa]|uniref:Uncharacterized protein n=1 Tax=Thermopolyspora flexuosa TaxID=103836 RepID=A0A543IPJ6_9ACTN|nr:hypothetical protein [Thermopolyspora flexuosa]PZN41398.1 MAG: hypothetical protein DIU60_17090 [Actinomycetota bacterium]TQM72490.1 hypothetical protein FHX40_4632 [Thermopolyspora flexuosa]GGM70259.1 hypothetical protein GCM10010106_15510 [Thermopolyspora flexuosa]
MTEQPYTYLSMSIDPGERSRVRMSLCGSMIRARAWVLDSGRPHLALEPDEADVTVSTTRSGPVAAKDLDIVRQVFGAAARHLAGCELMHAEHAQVTDRAA